MRFTFATACLVLAAAPALAQDPDDRHPDDRHLDEGALPLSTAPDARSSPSWFFLTTIEVETGLVPSHPGKYGHDTDDQGWLARRRLQEQLTRESLARRLAPSELYGYWVAEPVVDRVATSVAGEASTGKPLSVYQAKAEVQVLVGPTTAVHWALPEAVQARAELVHHQSSVQLTLQVRDGAFRYPAQTVRVSLAELHLLMSHPGELVHTPLGGLLRRAYGEALGDHRPNRPTVEVEVLFDQIRTKTSAPLAPARHERVALDMERVLGLGRVHVTRPLLELDARLARLLELPPPNALEFRDWHDLQQLRRSTRALGREDVAFLTRLAGEVEAKTREAETRLARLLDPYRDARGQVRWGKVTAAGLFQAGSSTARFSLALFLKELAVSAASQDPERLSEFFDFVSTTDFYLDYGLFAGGAALGEGLVKLGEAGVSRAGARFVSPRYQRFLRTYVKPGFVSSVLRSNVALAAGLALPQLVHGTFDGRTFAISFASLGISAALVQGALTRIPWVHRLRSGGLRSASNLARLGGWTYQAAELAVILVAGEALEDWWTERDALRRARDQLEQAAATLLRDGLAAGALADAATRQRILAAYLDAWDDYRQFLYAPLLQAQAKFRQRLAQTDRLVLKASGVSATLERLAQDGRYDALPLSDFAARQLDRNQAEGQARLARIVETYGDEFEAAVAEAYVAHRRGDPLDFTRLGRLRRVDPARRLGGDMAEAFAEPHADASRNRLQTYDDERAALLAAAAVLRWDVTPATTALDQLREADRKLAEGDMGLLGQLAPAEK